MGSRSNKMGRGDEESHPARAFGSPMSTPKPSGRTREKPEQSRGSRREAIKRYQEESVQEGRRRADDRIQKDTKPKEIVAASATADLSAGTAVKRVSGRRRQLDEAERKALGK